MYDVACVLVIYVVERAKIWDDIVRSLYISASSLVPFWPMCHYVLSGHFQCNILHTNISRTKNI